MRLLVLSGFAVVLALAGCGGDDPAESPRAAFIRQADAICGQLGRDTAALADASFKGVSAPPSAAQQAEYDAKSVALQRAGLAKLRALQAPPGEEAQASALWGALEGSIAQSAAAPADDPGAAGTDRFAPLARAYGLKVCGGSA